MIGQEVLGEAVILAGHLVQESANVAYREAGWNGVAGLACNALFKVLMHQPGVGASQIAEGIASGLANIFPQMPPEKLKDFLTLVEERTQVQLRGMNALMTGAAKLDD